MATALTSYNVAPNPNDSPGNTAVPIGSITMWSTATAPAQWLLCDGSAVSRNLYAALFSVIGTTYGAGDGSTTFNVPDMRGRLARGVNGSYALASTGGADTVNLIATDLPYHGHNVTDPTHQHTYQYGGGINVISSGGTAVAGANPNTGAYTTSFASTGITIPASLRDGSDNPIFPGNRTQVNVRNPYLTLNYIIKSA
jgi:microcystin-dependent protein